MAQGKDDKQFKKLIGQIQGTFIYQEMDVNVLVDYIRNYKDLAEDQEVEIKHLKSFLKERKDRVKLLKKLEKVADLEKLEERGIEKRIKQVMGLPEDEKVKDSDLKDFLNFQKLMDRTAKFLNSTTLQNRLFSIINKATESIETESKWKQFSIGINIFFKALALILSSPIVVCSIISSGVQNRKLFQSMVEELEKIDFEKEPDKAMEHILNVTDKILEMGHSVLEQENLFQYLGNKDNALSILHITKAAVNKPIDSEITKLNNTVQKLRAKGVLNEKEDSIVQKHLETLKLLLTQKKLMNNLATQFEALINEQGVEAITNGTALRFLQNITKQATQIKEGNVVERIAQAVAQAAIDNENKEFLESGILAQLASDFLINNYKVLQEMGANLPEFQTTTKRNKFIKESIDTAVETVYELSALVGNKPKLIERAVQLAFGAQEIVTEIEAIKESAVAINSPEARLKVGKYTKETVSLLNLLLEDKKLWNKILSEDKLVQFGQIASKFGIMPQIALLEAELQKGALKDSTKKELQAQLKGIQLAQNILNNNAKQIHGILGDNAGKFLADVLNGIMAKEITISSMVLEIFKHTPTKELLNKQGLKDLITSILQENEATLRELSEGELPHIANKEEREKLIEESVDAGLDVVFDLIELVGNKPELIQDALQLAFKAEALAKEGEVLGKQIEGFTKDPKALDANTVLAWGANLKETVKLIGPLLEDKTLFQKVIAEDKMPQVMNIVNKLALQPIVQDIKLKLNKEGLEDNTKKKLAAQLKGIQLAQNILNNNAKQIHGILGDNAGKFLSDVLNGIMAKEITISSMVLEIFKHAPTKDLLNKQGLKDLIISILQENEELLRDLSEGALPQIADKEERNKFIEESVGAGLDVAFELIELLGNKPEVIQDALQLAFKAEALAKEGEALGGQIEQLQKSGKPFNLNTRFKIGKNLKEALRIAASLLENEELLQKVLSEDKLPTLLKLIDKLALAPQVELLQTALDALDPTDKKQKAEIEAQLKGIQIARNIFQKRAHQIHKVMGKDIDKFLQGILGIIEPMQSPDSKETAFHTLSIEELVAFIVSGAPEFNLANKQGVKELVEGILKDNHSIIQELSAGALPLMKNEEKRNEVIEKATDVAIDIVFDLGNFLGHNPEFLTQAIQLGIKMGVNATKDPKAIEKEFATDLPKMFGGLTRTDAHIEFGENMLEILNLVNTALNEQEHLGKTLSASNLERICKSVNRVFIRPMLEDLSKANIELQKQNIELDKLKTTESEAEIESNNKIIAANNMQIQGLELGRNIMEHHVREVYEVFGNDVGIFLHSIVQSLIPERHIDAEGKEVVVTPTLIDIISNFITQTGKLEIYKKDKLKTLLKSVVNDNKELLKAQLEEIPDIGDILSRGLLFENIPNLKERQKKLDNMLNTVVESFYEITSAIGRNSEVSGQIVEAIFAFIQPAKEGLEQDAFSKTIIELQKERKELKKEKKALGKKKKKHAKKEEEFQSFKGARKDRATQQEILKVQKAIIDKEEAEIGKKEANLTTRETEIEKQKFTNLMNLVGKIESQDREKVLKSVLKLASAIQIPGMENLMERLNLDSPIFGYLTDALKDDDFYKEFFEKLGEIIYTPSGIIGENNVDMTKILNLVVYLDSYYRGKNSSITREQYEKEIAPHVVEIAYGAVRGFPLPDIAMRFMPDMVGLIHSVVTSPEAVMQGLKAGTEFAEGNILKGIGKLPIGKAFSIIASQGSKKDFGAVAKLITGNIPGKDGKIHKLSNIMNHAQKNLYTTDSPEQLYLKLGYLPSVEFKGAKNGILDFSKVKIDADIDFYKCTFADVVHLNGASCNQQKLKFSRCNFEKGIVLNLKGVEEVKNAVATIGAQKLQSLINKGKVQVSLTLTPKDNIEKLRDAMVLEVPGKNQHSVDNLAGLLLSGAINFTGTLTLEQENKLQTLFGKAVAERKTARYEEDVLFKTPVNALKKDRRGNKISHKEFQCFSKYVGTKKMGKMLSELLPEKGRSTHNVSRSFFEQTAHAFKNSGMPLAHAKGGKPEVDEKIVEVIKRIRTIHPQSTARRYSARLERIIEKGGFEIFDRLHPILIELNSKFKGKKDPINKAFEIIVDEMVAQVIDNNRSVTECMKPIEEQVRKSQAHFSFKDLVSHSLHHTLLEYGIEKSSLRAKVYDIVHQTEGIAQKMELKGLLQEILELNVKGLPEQKKVELREQIIICLYDRFTKHPQETVKAIKNNDFKRTVDTWVEKQVKEVQGVKSWSRSIEAKVKTHFQAINIAEAIAPFFQTVVSIEDITKHSVPKNPVVASVSVYDGLKSEFTISESVEAVIGSNATKIGDREL